MSKKRLKLLAVDDEPGICELTKVFLERSEGIEVETCNSVSEALAMLDKNEYDVIVSDYQMPGGDGISFLRTLRERNDDIPFILFTGKGREDVVIEALNIGADFYLQKGGSPMPMYAEMEQMVRIAVERRWQQLEIRESKNRFRSVLEKLPIGLWLADKDGKLILGNPMGQVIWGGNPKVGQDEYAIFKAWRLPGREPVHADDWALGHAVNEGRTTDWELLEIEGFDGKLRTIYNWAAPLRNEKDEIAGAFVINQDITAQVETLKVLEESERKYRSYIEKSPFGLFIARTDGRFIDVNEAACRITGYTSEEILSMSVFDLHNDLTIPEARDHFSRVVREGSASGSTMFVHKSGEIRSWFIEAVALAPNSFMAFVQDTTERRSMEMELREKERAVECASSGIALFDLDGRFKYVNERVLEILGLSDESEIIGKSFVDLHADHSPPTELMEAIMRGDSWRDEVPLLRKDGKKVLTEMVTTLVVGNDRKPLAVMCSINDITERNNMEIAIRSANRKLNLLSNLTMHDLGNQLMVLMGSLTMAQAKGGPSPEIERALKAGRRMDSIISFAKDYESLGVNEPRWHNLSVTINDALQSYRGEVEVRLDIPNDLEIFADDLIGKVFLNLYQNALMHGERVTRLDCWTQMEGDSLSLFFADDGIGVRTEDKEKLFQRGFGRNTGQGLFLAREVLDLTGMHIDEVGESGKGAVFRIRTPPESVRRADG